MRVGVLKEIKKMENRVSLLPSGVEILKAHGHEVFAEKDCGLQSGFTNEDYIKAGAKILNTAAELYQTAEMVMKVKEPLPAEYNLMREGQTVFTYFHFAASRELTEAVIRSKCIAIAYETIAEKDGTLPLLTPMSEVAGRMSIQQGAANLQKETGGRGVLLGGVPGVEPGTVVVLGGGVVGTNAAKMAAGLGARVVIMDINLDRLRYLDDVMPKNVITMMSNPANIRQMLPHADLLVGAVLIPGAKAPKLVTREMLKLMKPGSVIVDVAIDQGGCIETIHATTHDDPVYEVDGIIHYGVANMPGAVPRTSTIALTNATLPYAIQIADKGYKQAILENPEIYPGANIVLGKVTFKGVAEAFNMPFTPVEAVLK
ncbi:alanine dehydrogenase [candidate division KSB1 bacterium]|nr:alanine dehydrogenase [candidate division KSB1 bacterium]